MLVEQIIEFDLRGQRPMVVHVLLQLVICMTKQKLLRKSLTGLLFTPKILQEIMNLAFLHLGQITY